MKTVTTQRIEFIQNIKKGIVSHTVQLISVGLVTFVLGVASKIVIDAKDIAALPITVAEHTEQISAVENIVSTINSNVSAILFLQYRTIVAQKSSCTTDRCVDEYTKLEVDALSTYQNSLKK